MHLNVNGKVSEYQPGISIAELLRQLDLVHIRLAVELNEEIIPQSSHAQQCLFEGDSVEIVRAVGGG